MNKTLWFVVEDHQVLGYYESESMALLSITPKEPRMAIEFNFWQFLLAAIVFTLIGAACGACAAREIWVGWKNKAVHEEHCRLVNHYQKVIEGQEKDLRAAQAALRKITDRCDQDVQQCEQLKREIETERRIKARINHILPILTRVFSELKEVRNVLARNVLAQDLIQSQSAEGP